MQKERTANWVSMAREVTGRARQLYSETVAGPVPSDEGVDEVDNSSTDNSSTDSLQPTPVRRPPTLEPCAPVRPPRPTLWKPLRPVTTDEDADDDVAVMDPSKVSIMNV